MHKKLYKALIVMIILLLPVMAACGSDEQAENTNIETEIQQETTAVEATTAVEKTTEQTEAVSEVKTETAEEVIPDNCVKDAFGRIVEIPEKIDKICATHIFGGKMLFAMQQKDKIAYQLQLGADTDAVAKLDSVYGALDSISGTANGTDSPEALIKFGVDLVVTDVAEGEEMVKAYENAGLTVVAVKGETFEQVYESARMLGKIFSNPERAEELVEFIEGKRSAISDKVKDLKDGDKPIVLISGSGGVFTAATSKMFQHEMIETVGGINAAAALDKARWARISPEDIIAWNPDYIVLGSSFGVDTVNSVLGHEALQGISAVKNKQVYTFPSNLGWWDFPLPQSILGITWLASVIHPELFVNIDIQQEADEVYKFIYGYTYTEMGGIINETSLPKK